MSFVKVWNICLNSVVRFICNLLTFVVIRILISYIYCDAEKKKLTQITIMEPLFYARFSSLCQIICWRSVHWRHARTHPFFKTNKIVYVSLWLPTTTWNRFNNNKIQLIFEFIHECIYTIHGTAHGWSSIESARGRLRIPMQICGKIGHKLHIQHCRCNDT